MEQEILSTLMLNSEYFTKVFPFLEEDHFSSIEYQQIFKAMKQYQNQTDNAPKPREIGMILKTDVFLKEKKELQELCLETFKDLFNQPKIEDVDYLTDRTQDFVKVKEMTKAILKAADVIKQEGELSVIPAYIEEASKIHFDSDTGLNYTESVKERLEFYKTKKQGLFTTGIKILDKDLGGGYAPKTLNCVFAVSHGGKCHNRKTKIDIFCSDEEKKKIEEFLKCRNSQKNQL